MYPQINQDDLLYKVQTILKSLQNFEMCILQDFLQFKTSSVHFCDIYTFKYDENPINMGGKHLNYIKIKQYVTTLEVYAWYHSIDKDYNSSFSAVDRICEHIKNKSITSGLKSQINELTKFTQPFQSGRTPYVRKVHISIFVN